jgi:signal transduction histidine kinase
MSVRPTLRLRLTALYAALFLLGGGLLLGASYLLVARTLTTAPDRVESLAIQRVDPSLDSPGQQQAERRFEREVRDQVASDALGTLRLRYGLALLGLVGLSVALGWLVSGRALARVEKIRDATGEISGERLGRRIRLDGPEDELKELADTIDSMLARLDEAFERQRRFVGSASHELRTPLAVMRTEIEVALANADTDRDELRATAERVGLALDRSERLIGSLLVLARSDALSERNALDLATATRHALTSLGHEIAAAGLQLSTDLDPAEVYGDRRLLERLVANLVENAVRHNENYGFISISTSSTRATARLVIENSGPVVPDDAVSTLTEPFRRLERRRTRARGTGLGLSIAGTVVRAHGGRLSLEPLPGGGLRAMVELPLGAPAETADATLREVEHGFNGSQRVVADDSEEALTGARAGSPA